ncbi:MAG: hypothetical protein ABWY39_06785 [Mycobacterium sp.]
MFADELTHFAARCRNPRLTPIIRHVTGPLYVAVRGRDGVGRGTVAAALAGAGVTVTADVDAADVDVMVIAEVLKPEERAVLAGTAKPTLTVLNKADLTGYGAGGPMALAQRRAAQYRALTGVPTVPTVGLLAIAVLDDELVYALRLLTTEPADMSSADAFLQTEHRLSGDVRSRLLDTLDRFGIAHAVLALRRGADAASLPALLRRVSQVDRVVAQLTATGAAVRYRRVRSALTELRALAVQSGDDRLTEFLSADDTVIAVMAAAVEVIEATGVDVDPGDDPAAHLRRALHWRRYAGAPLDPLRRNCAADISRGSLRLLRRAQPG